MFECCWCCFYENEMNSHGSDDVQTVTTYVDNACMIKENMMISDQEYYFCQSDHN